MTHTPEGTVIQRSNVEGMLAAVAPEWTVRDVEPSEEGSEAVYFVTAETPTGDRTVVLKAATRDVVADPIARAEPRVLELLGRETSIPVPGVIGYVDDDPDLPTPFFVAEHRPGETGAHEFGDLSPAALERVMADAGRHLAELHGVRSFDRFGHVGVVDGDLAVVGADADPADRWADWLLADAESTLDGLEGGRFDDIVPRIREHLRTVVPAIEGPDVGVLVHWDYRLGNLLLDPDTGRTTTVLDWADLLSGDPVYNLVTVEDHNVIWQTEDPVLRRRLRNAFLDAYAATAGADPLAGVRDRKRIYHLYHRLNAMACIPDWYDDDAVRAERAAVHRSFVRDHLE